VKWLRVSLFAQAALAVYFQAVQWLPLGRWNVQCPSGDQLACGLSHQGLSVPGFQPLGVMALEGSLAAADALYCLAFTLPFFGYWAGYATGRRWLMWPQIGGYAAWLALQVVAWWIPYLVGATDERASRYRAVFGESIQVLPSFGNHLPPDGLHFLLQVLLVVVIASGLAGLVRPGTVGRPLK